jgi:1-acyl-sn-glycerol-3-phosphate acyltransferase
VLLMIRASARLLAMCLLLLGGLLTVFIAFPFMSPRRRDKTVQGWSRWLMASVGVRVRLNANFRPGDLDEDTYGRMIVANHVSWLDIFVINSVAPSCFIAKDDIASWPLVGTLVGSVGTLFLERGKRHAVHNMIKRIEQALKSGRRIAVFPEGTTSDGKRLLPFHGNLIEAAVQANSTVVPLGLRYFDEQGALLRGEQGIIYFAGEITFVQSVLRIVQAPGVIAEVVALPDSAAIGESLVKQRHALANAARGQISQALGLPLEDNLPEIVRDLRGAQR